MPRRGYRQTAEHKAKRASSISAAMTGRRHSEKTKGLIGEGVRRAARARRWWKAGPSERDFLVSLAISRMTYWWHIGRESPVGYLARDEFERLPRPQQDRVLKKIITVVDWVPGQPFHATMVEFVDGERWPSVNAGAVPVLPSD